MSKSFMNFYDSIIKDKSLLDYTNLFFSNKYGRRRKQIFKIYIRKTDETRSYFIEQIKKDLMTKKHKISLCDLEIQ